MKANVTYTEQHFMQIVVIAEVFDPETRSHVTSNVFHYTYSNKIGHVPILMPKTYHEAMWYLDGRRHFQNAMDLDGTPEPPIRTIDPCYKP